MRCIVDSNLLMDLNNGSILDLFFRLPLEVQAPDAVFDEVTQPVKARLLALGLRQAVLTTEQLIDAARMHTRDAYLSLGDCSAFVVARNTGAALLTGTMRLRELAIHEGIAAYDAFWVIEQFEETRMLSGPEALLTLNQMLTRSYV